MQRTLQTMMSKLMVVAFFGAILIFAQASTAIADTQIHKIADAPQIRMAILIDKSISNIQDARDGISAVSGSIEPDIRVDRNIEISKYIQRSIDGAIRSEISNADINHISDLSASNIARPDIRDICESSAIADIRGNNTQASQISQGLISNSGAISRINNHAIRSIQSSGTGIANDWQIIGDPEEISISQSSIKETSVNRITRINADIIQDISAINGRITQKIAAMRIITAPNRINLIA